MNLILQFSMMLTMRSGIKLTLNFDMLFNMKTYQSHKDFMIRQRVRKF